MSTEDSLPDIDWKRGSVTICNGRIYVSPNCNRPHALLPEPSSSLASPFLDRGPNQLTVHNFKQPVWWNNSWGWMGFMPLSPSFLSTPFSPLAWTPKITSTDISKQAEDHIVEACSIIRLNHTIPGELPPLPSDLGFLCHHSSQSVAKRRAEISCDWFVLWMGFLSYLTLMAQAHPRYTFPNPTDRQTVKWYSCLQERGFPHVWLEGLAKSRVCRFDADIARVGVVLWLSDTSTKHRPSIAWFMKYHIPVWFVLDAQEESWIRAQRHLSKVLPLQAMINDALTQYFNGLSAEVKSVVMVYYLNTTFRDVAVAMQKVLRVSDLSTQTFHHCLQAITPQELDRMPQLATTQDSETVLRHLLQQLALHEATIRLKSKEVHYPWPQMVDTDDFQDAKLYETWQEFFHQQEIRHAERERTESNQDRQQCLARDKNRALKKCIVYQWKQIVSGGQIFYARIRVSRKRQEQVLISFMKKDPMMCKFNAFADPPEWDLYEHFARVGPTTTQDPESEVSNSDDVEFGSPRPKAPLDVNPSYNPTPMHAEEYYGPHNFTPLSPLPHSGVSGHSSPSHFLHTPSYRVATEQPQSALHKQEFPITTTDVQPATVSVTGVPMQEHGNPNEENEHITLDPSHDIVNHVAMFFGYTPILNKELSNSEIGWKNCIKVIGCRASESGQMVGNNNQGIEHFVSQLLRGSGALDPDLDDLNPRNHNFLAALYPIQEKVMRVNSRLYIFQEPQSSSVDWCLGVTTTAAALLLVRLILQNRDHTLMTLTEPLLQMQVPFHTLLLFPDADSSLRQCESVIRDVSQYLYPSDYEFATVDFEDYTTLVQEFLSRPHGCAALLQGGLIARIASRYLGFDTVADGLSSEVCLHLVGDVLKSGQEGFKYMDDCLEDQDIEILIGTYHMKTKQANQTTVVSWLPPPSAFYKQTKVNYWTYWSPGDDEILELVYDDIYAGKGKPKSKRDWRKWVRGRQGPGAATSTSIFYNNLVERNENFMRSVFGIDSED